MFDTLIHTSLSERIPSKKGWLSGSGRHFGETVVLRSPNHYYYTITITIFRGKELGANLRDRWEAIRVHQYSIRRHDFF